MRILRRRIDSPGGWAILLFLLALAPRLPGLRVFLTSDEQTNLYLTGSQFVEGLLSGDLSLTYWHFYPGVTMSWVETLGLAGAWALTRLTSGTTETLAQFIRRPILDLILAVRLPYALLTAASVAAFYLLARRLLGRRPALLGALFIAFDPFFLAHSRVAHGDASVAIFMGLSALAFFVHLQVKSSQNERRRWLILSAVMGALAALTKAPGPFMAPFVILVGAMDWLVGSWQVRRLDWRLARRWLIDLPLWGGVAALIFVALWPAMWVEPAGTLVRMLNETFGKVGAGHLVFFMGQPTLNPGPWFYLYVIPFRLTPVTLIGVLASGVMALGGLIGLAWKGDESASQPRAGTVRVSESFLPDHYVAAMLLWLFAVTLLLVGDFSPKKQDRYLLPLFPILDLLAAFAVVQISEWASRRVGESASRRVGESANRKMGQRANTHPTGTSQYAILVVLLFLLLTAHALPALTAYPYYLAHFNPLMGGLPRAVETTLVGWGEGMEQVAAYLNQRPDADQLYVAATPSQTLLPYFVGTGENFYTNDVALRADYVVLYVAQVQRLAPSPEIVRYFQAMEPEHIVPVRGVPYAWIYPGPKLITHDLPSGAVPANVGFGDQLRLAGYQISNQRMGESASQRVSESANRQVEESPISNLRSQLTLYWHALARMDTDYTVSVRLVAPDGVWLAQHDGWPAGGLLPTSQWRQGDYVRDEHSLDLPPDLPMGEYAVQVVVYDAASGASLSEPVKVTSIALSSAD